MPNLTAHVALAVSWGESLNHALVQRCIGAYVLGATTPDIRAMTRVPREETHFMHLESPDLTSGVAGLLQSHPHLRDATRLPEPTAAFLLGYFAHLVADQGWITTVYRPYFADRARFPDQAEAMVLDRALQLDEDRRADAAVRPLLASLADAEKGVDVPFLSPANVRDWRVWVQGFLARDFSWERLRSLSRRRQRDEHLDAAAQAAESFLASVDRSLERLTEQVPAHATDAYRQRSADAFLQVGREFFKCG
ncbi:MAG: hypothetical protein FJ315_00670 [SAR202 cluster bacterium]|nr:hypothetical protein [SAR202 cluster bacterium]